MIPDRAQTTLDFAVGMSLFLTVVMFVFAFVPGVLAPFTDGTVEETAAVDRVADHLVQNALTRPSAPYVLDVECTDQFFEEADPTTPELDCRYEGGGDGGAPSSVVEAVGATDRGNVHVEITGDLDAEAGSNLVCWDETDQALYEHDPDGGSPCDTDDTLFVAGPTPPSETDATMTASRQVTLGSQGGTLRVTMW